jgi:hypothetical protein
MITNINWVFAMHNKHFTSMTSFNTHRNPWKELLLFPLFFTWETWVLEVKIFTEVPNTWLRFNSASLKLEPGFLNFPLICIFFFHTKKIITNVIREQGYGCFWKLFSTTIPLYSFQIHTPQTVCDPFDNYHPSKFIFLGFY